MTYFIQKQSPGDVLYKNVFWKSLQNSQENTCIRVSILIETVSVKTEGKNI